MVKRAGYTEDEIMEELDNLSEGKAWVKFAKVDESKLKEKQE